MPRAPKRKKEGGSVGPAKRRKKREPILKLENVILDDAAQEWEEDPECGEEIDKPPVLPKNPNRKYKGIQHLEEQQDEPFPVPNPKSKTIPKGNYAHRVWTLSKLTRNGGGAWELDSNVQLDSFMEKYPIEGKWDGRNIVKDWPQEQLRVQIDDSKMVSIVTLRGDPVPGVWEPIEGQDKAEKANDICTAMVLNRASTIFTVGNRSDLLTSDIAQNHLNRLLGTLSVKPGDESKLNGPYALLSTTCQYVKGMVQDNMIVGVKGGSPQPVSLGQQINWIKAFKHYMDIELEETWVRYSDTLDDYGMKGVDLKTESNGLKAPHSLTPFFEYGLEQNWMSLKRYIRAVTNPEPTAFIKSSNALSILECNYPRYDEWLWRLSHSLSHRKPIPVLVARPMPTRGEDYVFDRDCEQKEEGLIPLQRYLEDLQANPAFTQLYLMFPERDKWSVPRKVEKILEGFTSEHPEDSFNFYILIAGFWTWLVIEAKRREDLKMTKNRKDLGLGEWMRKDPDIKGSLPAVSLGVFLLYFETMIRVTVQHKLAGFPHPFYFAHTAYELDRARSPHFAIRSEEFTTLSNNDFVELMAEFKARMNSSIRVYPWELDGTNYPLLAGQVSYKGALTGIGTIKYTMPPLSEFLKGSDIYRPDSYIRAVAEMRSGASFEWEPAPEPGEEIDAFRWDRADQAFSVRTYYSIPVFLGNMSYAKRPSDSDWYTTQRNNRKGITKKELQWAKERPLRLACLRWLTEVEGLNRNPPSEGSDASGDSDIEDNSEDSDSDFSKSKEKPKQREEDKIPEPVREKLDTFTTTISWELALEKHCDSIMDFCSMPMTEFSSEEVKQRKKEVLLRYYKMLMGTGNFIPHTLNISIGTDLQLLISDLPEGTAWEAMEDSDRRALAKRIAPTMEHSMKCREVGLDYGPEGSEAKELGDKGEVSLKSVSANGNLIQELEKTAKLHPFGKTAGGRALIKGLTSRFPTGSLLNPPSFAELMKEMEAQEMNMAESLKRVNQAFEKMGTGSYDKNSVDDMYEEIMGGIDQIFPNVWADRKDLPGLLWKNKEEKGSLVNALELLEGWIGLMKGDPGLVAGGTVKAMVEAVGDALEFYCIPSEWKGIMEEYGKLHLDER